MRRSSLTAADLHPDLFIVNSRPLSPSLPLSPRPLCCSPVILQGVCASLFTIICLCIENKAVATREQANVASKVLKLAV